jgi:hypothetical protein
MEKRHIKGVSPMPLESVKQIWLERERAIERLFQVPGTRYYNLDMKCSPKTDMSKARCPG